MDKRLHEALRHMEVMEGHSTAIRRIAAELRIDPKASERMMQEEWEKEKNRFLAEPDTTAKEMISTHLTRIERFAFICGWPFESHRSPMKPIDAPPAPPATDEEIAEAAELHAEKMLQ